MFQADLALGGAADNEFRTALDPEYQPATDGSLPVPVVSGGRYLGRYRCGSRPAVLDLTDSYFLGNVTNLTRRSPGSATSCATASRPACTAR